MNILSLSKSNLKRKKWINVQLSDAGPTSSTVVNIPFACNVKNSDVKAFRAVVYFHVWQSTYSEMESLNSVSKIPSFCNFTIFFRAIPVVGAITGSQIKLTSTLNNSIRSKLDFQELIIYTWDLQFLRIYKLDYKYSIELNKYISVQLIQARANLWKNSSTLSIIVSFINYQSAQHSVYLRTRRIYHDNRHTLQSKFGISNFDCILIGAFLPLT